MEYINIDLERKVISSLFHTKELMIRISNRRNLDPNAFADKSIRMLYKIMRSFFHKHGRMISLDLLRAEINRYSVKSKNSELFKEKLESVVDRFFLEKPSEEQLENFDVYVNELNILWKGRLIQEYQIELFDKIDGSDVDGAENYIKGFHLPNYGDDINSGEYFEDLSEREQEVINKVNNPEDYHLLPTGIPKLDSMLEGGFSSEFVVISGSSNDGKSMLMQQLATNASRLKRDVLLFPIGEMNKIQTQNRIDCNIADIDFKFFRNPILNYSKEIHKQWRDKVKKFSKRSGKLQVVEIRKAATVNDILEKCYEYMSIWQKPISAIYVDSIDNLVPENRKFSKDWLDYGEICWDLFRITKDFKNRNGTYGIPVIASTQLRKANKEVSSSNKTRSLNESDVGSSPFQYRYSEVFIGMKYNNEYSMELQVMKGRGVSRGTGVICFHNFPKGRFDDPEMEKLYASQVPQEEKQELQEIESEVEE